MRKVIPFLIILLSAAPLSAEVFVTKDGTGTYVGGLPGFYTGTADIKGTPSVDQNGFYVDGTVKSIAKKDTWQKIKMAIDTKLYSSKKASSKK